MRTRTTNRTTSDKQNVYVGGDVHIAEEEFDTLIDFFVVMIADFHHRVVYVSPTTDIGLAALIACHRCRKMSIALVPWLTWKPDDYKKKVEYLLHVTNKVAPTNPRRLRSFTEQRKAEVIEVVLLTKTEPCTTNMLKEWQLWKSRTTEYT